MSGFTKYFEDLVLNTFHDGVGTATIVGADRWIALSSTQPDDAGGNVTEPVDGGYARVLLTATNLTITGGGAGGTPSVASNPAALDFPHSPTGGNWTVAYIGIYDSSGTGSGNLIGSGALLLSKTIGQSESLQFAAGAITISLS